MFESHYCTEVENFRWFCEIELKEILVLLLFGKPFNIFLLHFFYSSCFVAIVAVVVVVAILDFLNFLNEAIFHLISVACLHCISLGCLNFLILVRKTEREDR